MTETTDTPETKSAMVQIRIRLVSPMLGDLLDRDGNRTFNIETYGETKYFIPNNAQWRWALGEALRTMGKDSASLDYISLPYRIKSPKINYYTRARSKRNKGDKTIFQCYQKGVIITFNVALLSSLEQETHCGEPPSPLTEEDVKQAFAIVGETIGISPWGNIYSYGRFVLEP